MLLKKTSGDPKNEHLMWRYHVEFPCKFKDTIPLLVTEDIHASIKNGVTYTPTGEKFRQLVKERHGWDIGPCYVIACKCVRQEKPGWAGIFTSRIYNFLVVNMLVRGITYLDAEKITPETELQLGQALLDVLPGGTDDVVYEDLCQKDTLAYKLACRHAPVYKTFAYCEEFDGLAQWHYIGNNLCHANILPSIIGIRGRVYSGWNKDVRNESFYIILPEDRSDPSEEEKQRARDELLALLHSVDKCGVVRDERVATVFTTWSALPPEMHWALIRG